MATEPRVIGADEVCIAVEQSLRTRIPVVIDALDLGATLKPFRDWQQLPTIEALSSANLPAGAVTSPGLTEPPTYSRATGWTATWRVAVGVYARGRDHSDTQAQVRDWIKVCRTALMGDRSVGGLAKSLRWVGEEYALVPGRNSARTIGAGAVAVDVTVENVLDLGSLDLPVVLATTHDLTFRSTDHLQES